MFGEQQNGVGFETHQTAHRRGEGGTLTLDLEVGMGQIEVRRVLTDAVDDVTDDPPRRRPCSAERLALRRGRRGRRGRCRRR